MSILDIFKNADFGSMLDALTSQAGNAARSVKNATPGGLGGLLGAGALGALLGNVLPGNAGKGVALAGLGAAAWNFYQKWAAQQATQAGTAQAATRQAPQAAQQKALPADPTVTLIARAMTYAARSDGSIDPVEQGRMETVLRSLVPAEDIEPMLAKLRSEQVDPVRIAKEVSSPEQAQDVYRLSCMAIDADQFMEQSYLSGLAQAMGLSQSVKADLETEAEEAKKQLKEAMNR